MLALHCPPGYDIDRPEELCIDNDAVEEVRDQVLSWSVDQAVDHEKLLGTCLKCRWWRFF